jgi:cell surface protein SprA
VRSYRSALALFFLATVMLAAISCSNDDDEEDAEERELVRIGGSDEKIYDFEYERRKYFFLTVPYSNDSLKVESQEVAVFLNDPDVEADSRSGEDIEPANASVTGEPDPVHFSADFLKLVPNDDYFLVGSDFSSLYQTPFLVLRQPLDPEMTLAVSYVARNQMGQVVEHAGNYFQRGSGDTLHLKMLHAPLREKPMDLRAGPWAATVPLERRNVYDLGVRNIDPGTFTARIRFDSEYQPATLNGISFLEITGLDLLNNMTFLGLRDSSLGPDHGPDGRIDPFLVDYDNGLVVFPDTRPFDPSSSDLNGVIEGGLPNHGAQRRKALGYRTVMTDPTDYFYERLPESEAQEEVNSAIYDRRDIDAAFRKFYLTGEFRAWPGMSFGPSSPVH